MVRASVRAMNVEDEWINAGCAMIANIPPDLKPMAAMFRRARHDNKPIPPEICDLLAELFDPGDAPLHNVRLILEFIPTEIIPTANKEIAFFKKWNAVGVYDRLRAEGKSEEEALEQANRIFPCEKSAFHRAKAFIHEHADLIPNMLKRIRDE
jgi:hypothetical protein